MTSWLLPPVMTLTLGRAGVRGTSEILPSPLSQLTEATVQGLLGLRDPAPAEVRIPIEGASIQLFFFFTAQAVSPYCTLPKMGLISF